jgi:hypothetical protein
VPDLYAHTTGGVESGGNGKVEQRGSQIGARFGQRGPEEGDLVQNMELTNCYNLLERTTAIDYGNKKQTVRTYRKKSM